MAGPSKSDAQGIERTAASETVSLSVAPRESIVIGRAASCDIVVKDIKASRRHCRLSRQGDRYVLEDLGSKNGTYVQGARIEAPSVLKADQTFKIGDTVFYLSAK